ncbi:uncharacterized protein E0L32_002803 [Thyridium curvatum]|uniref:Uncharacterized protein n=1 Tax=Thyridium curvatum TaxID=1093900 RepID=A0A507B629_9PEZI|nr:uncharacterized protein E0L32_002803 [Thyridium curvatum]TPX17702.1 hypothetical protein E0L32_002803 [Thyridium curvatum]
MTLAQSGPDPAPPPEARVTVVLTTSPTPSAPSTELICDVLDSFRQHCAELARCRIIVVMDTYEQVVDKPRLKKGRVTENQASFYGTYKDRVKRLMLGMHGFGEAFDDFHLSTDEVKYGNPLIPSNNVKYTITRTKNGRVSFIEPNERLGFGLAVHAALKLVETEYVWVQQHDWVLRNELPLQSLLEIMLASECDSEVPIKYICLSAPRMQSYAVSDHVIKHPELLALTKTLKRDFVPSSQPERPVSLTPMFFWHDKPHLASTRHYLERIFPTRLAIPRGAFIEDTIGHRARSQMKQGSWHRWATWLYYPDNGKILGLRHLNGRSYRGKENEAEKKRLWMERNSQKASKTAPNPQ